MYDTKEKKIKEARPEKSCWTWVKQSKSKKAWPHKFDHDEAKPAVRQEEHYQTHAQTLSPRVASIG